MPINRRDFIKATSAFILQFGLQGSGGRAEVLKSSVLTGADGSVSPDVHELLAQFTSPPDESKVGGYWWWFNNLVSKEGITRDLEEFKAKGIMEVLLVNSAANAKTPMPSGVDIFSEKWFGYLIHALTEAQRLGIKVGFNLCAGWCMGGPWIEPVESGRWYLQSQMEVRGPVQFSGKLPLPDNTAGYKDVKHPLGIKNYFDLPLEKLDYRDSAVTAFRLPDEGSVQVTGSRKETLSAKANREDASNRTPSDIIMERPSRDWANESQDAPVPVNSVVDLTDRLKADGSLDWEVPAGRWMIVRTGHRMTGSKVFLGLPGADGLSVDWLNRNGVEKQFQAMGMRILDRVKPFIGNTLVYFCDDSFEDGFPNWTVNMLEQFEKYRGYDATPYLPALCGFIIGSADISERFLHDYRKTVADLMADEHYGRFAELCHEQGLLVQNESAGPSRSASMCMDGLKNLGRSDLPMGEFWLGVLYGTPEEEDPSLGYGLTRLFNGQNMVTKMVASAAHVYGKKLASAESFTSTGRVLWYDHPHTLKYAADRAFCEGINRIMIHTTTCTRPEDGLPGYEYYAGTHFNRNVTWWEQSGPFLTYLARCQALLRAGHFVADVLYYNGDGAPNLVEVKHIYPELGKGYDYDVCNEEVLLTRLGVKDGRIALPDGMSYSILVLPENDKMPLPVLKKLIELRDAGANIVGSIPSSSAPGLKGYPQVDAEVKQLADDLWFKADPAAKGAVYGTLTPREALADLRIVPDFTVNDSTAFIDFIHRRTDGADIYFLLNRKRQPEQLTAQFRVDTTRKPILLDTLTGNMRLLNSKVVPVTATGQSVVEIDMTLDSRVSCFVVFVENADKLPGIGKAHKKFVPSYDRITTLYGPWLVNFDVSWGGPAEVEFPALLDWSQHGDERIRHFSGKATYRKSFDLPKTADGIEKQGELFLDLGDVKNIAEVRLNGKSLGVAWTSPWRLPLGDAVLAEGNQLEIDVINVWTNRLIADAALPKDKRLTNTNTYPEPGDALLPAGLLGPVEIVREVW